MADERQRTRRTLREAAGVTRLHRRVPTATIEYEETELVALLDCLKEEVTFRQSVALERAYQKTEQALAIESAPGGNFYDAGDAA